MRTWMGAGLAWCVLLATAWPGPGAQAQEPPGTALEREFADGAAWTVESPMAWRIGQTRSVIRVPQGFVHDKASVPRALWTFFPKSGPYTRAAVIHDWLYWAQPCTRAQADNLLMIAMKESGVSWWRRQLVYLAYAPVGRAHGGRTRPTVRMAFRASIPTAASRATSPGRSCASGCAAKTGAILRCRPTTPSAGTGTRRRCPDRNSSGTREPRYFTGIIRCW